METKRVTVSFTCSTLEAGALMATAELLEFDTSGLALCEYPALEDNWEFLADLIINNLGCLVAEHIEMFGEEPLLKFVEVAKLVKDLNASANHEDNA